jgi:hypothetical protein
LTRRFLLPDAFPTALLALALAAVSGCGTPEDKSPPPGVEPAAGDIAPTALANYLSRHEINTAEVRQGAQAALRAGKTYRKSIKDERGRPTQVGVSLDRRNILVVTTTRRDVCPDCQGSGTRETPLEMMERANVALRCLRCKGSGTLDRFKVEKKYILNPEDYADPARARAFIRDRSLEGAPPETADWLARLASESPRERAAACAWLDRNYVREGVFFQDLMPLLAKANKREENSKVMVWQFWAGRGDPALKDRAYYRVYADARTGKINRKGFCPEQ